MAVQFKKNGLCKICCSFDDETLTEITLDILFTRLSWADIKQKYNPKLPLGVKPLNDVNLNNHKKHSDGANVALRELINKGQPITEKEALIRIFEEKYKVTKNSKLVIQELFKRRLSNAQALQALLDATITEYRKVETSLNILGKATVQEHIQDLTSDIDSIYLSLQDTFFKDEKVNKGIPDASVMVNQVVINNFEGSIKDFMADVIDYLMGEFKDNPDKGKLIVKNIARIADKRVAPMINKLSSKIEEAQFEETR